MHAIMKFRMRRREYDVPHPLPLDMFALVKINKAAEFTKSASTLICKILLSSHLKSHQENMSVK